MTKTILTPKHTVVDASHMKVQVSLAYDEDVKNINVVFLETWSWDGELEMRKLLGELK